MLTYRKGSAGTPAAAARMAEHLLSQTLPQAAAELARYYQGGMKLPRNLRDPTLQDLARRWHDGALSEREAVAGLVAARAGQGGAANPDPAQCLADLRRAVAWLRLAETGQAVGEPRRDMDSRVAAALGIDPDRPVLRDELANLLNGQRSDGAAIPGKHTARHRVVTDRNGAAQELNPVSFVDCTFSADKSVSLAWAFAPTEAERNALWQCHRDAVLSAMGYFEQHFAQARIGKQGRDGLEPGRVGWVLFDHYTARPTVAIAHVEADGTPSTLLAAVPGDRLAPGDPDLHTHVPVFNAVFCDTGRVGSLYLHDLEQRKREVGGVYQAFLASNLRRLGVAVTLDPDTGSARLPAIPQRVRDHFSKMTRDGERAARDYAARHGQDWDRLSPVQQQALLRDGIRQARQGKADDIANFADWRRQADALGWTHHSVLGRAKAPDLSHEQRIRAAYEAALPFLEADLARNARILGSDARVAAVRGLVAAGIADTDEIGQVTAAMRRHGVRQDGSATELVWGWEGPHRFASVTTALHAAQEQAFVALARDAAADRTADLDAPAIDAAIAHLGLDFSGTHGEAQRAMAVRLASSGRLAIGIGAAGAGKTHLLQPLIQAWIGQGRAVFGSALAWRQADDLAAKRGGNGLLTAAGIPPARVSAFSVFMQRAGSGQIRLDRNAVVVLDEISLLGTSDMLRLLRLRARHGFSIVGIGDDRQCQSIEAGPVLELFRRALGEASIPALLTTRRQQSEREREIVGLFRAGQAPAALALKREDGSAELVPGGYRETVARVAALWRERVAAGLAAGAGEGVTVSAPTNRDARAIGAAIRDQRRALGLLGPDLRQVEATDGVERYTLALGVGDRLRLYRNTNALLLGDTPGRGPIGRNGSVVTVTAITDAGLVLRNADGRAGRVAWATLRDTSSGALLLAPGDVQTTHTAQGSTSDEHIYALPAGSAAVNGFAAYVSATRHRQRSFLLTSEGAERQQIAERRHLGDLRPVTADDVWANWGRNLSRQPEKDHALAFLERAADLRRGVVRSGQMARWPAEQRAAEGLEPTRLHRTAARARAAAALSQVLPTLAAWGETRRAAGQRLSRLGERLRDLTQDLRRARERDGPDLGA